MPCGGRRAYFDTGSHRAKFLYYGTGSRDFVSRKWARLRYLSQALPERRRRELTARRAREILGPVGDGNVKPPRLRTARWKFLKGKLQTLQA